MNKKLLVLNYISIIIINILKIRNLYNNLVSNNILDTMILVKDISKFTLNLLSLNMIKSERPASYQKSRSRKFSEVSDPYHPKNQAYSTQDNVKSAKRNTSKDSK